MSNVGNILDKKGKNVWSVKPQDTVYDTIKLMSEKNIGAVLVLEDDNIVGIFSERDFIRHCAKKNLQLDKIYIKDLMTTRILFVSPAQTPEECMSLMTAKRIRHLPVLEDNKLV